MTTAKLLLATGLLTTGLAVGAIGGCSSDSTETEPGTTATQTPTCPAGQVFCEGECTIIDIDPDHCGQCGRRCGPDQVCAAGQCSSDCTGGTTKCGDICVNLNTDQANCGSCGNACAPGEVCDGNGSCVLSCPPSQTQCGALCVDTNTNNAHCGQCDNGCTGGEFCNGAGDCATTCQSGLVLCNGVCIDPQTNEQFCGAVEDCQDANAGDQCGQAEVCRSGSCEAVTCNDQWEDTPSENDTEATATPLAADPVSDCTDPVTFSGTINGNDVDWYAYEGQDDTLCIVNPRQYFDQASDAARLCVFVECVDTDATTQFTCPAGTLNATSPEGRFGCCDTGTDVDIQIDDLNCTGTWSEDAYVYIRIDDPSGDAGTCTSYVGAYAY
ncbi:MAG: hypothetical protein JRI23_36650 [Deltaproteobacteria bacterium]|jgi:hypothetical protein|nr:hypothetical protein [Deltaproteobacteria bacterium]MBW2537900.1 hypothetical protein [Deltaproteobacteria bacterium]